jgi:hypothetical protein
MYTHTHTHIHIYIYTYIYTHTQIYIMQRHSIRVNLFSVPSDLQDVSTMDTKYMSAPAAGPYEYDLAKIQQFV